MNQKKLTYSIREVAELMGVGKNTIYALAKARKIPVIQIGRRYVISAEKFNAWFQAQCEANAVIEL